MVMTRNGYGGWRGYQRGSLRFACRDCGHMALSPYVSKTAYRCFDCREVRRKPRPCRDCRLEVARRGSPRCEPCAYERYFFTDITSGRAQAQSEVSRARRIGLLASPRDMACADCGGAATEYDHRDYGQPLLVEPTCRGCNARRGSAKPREWSEEDALRALVASAVRGGAYRPRSSSRRGLYRRVPDRLHGVLDTIFVEVDTDRIHGHRLAA